MALEYHISQRGVPGNTVSLTSSSTGLTHRTVIPVVTLVSDTGVASGAAASPIFTSGAPLPAGTDRSGNITAGGTAQQLAPANTNRQALTGQNISVGDLWINEIGGTAAVDTQGSYRVATMTSFSVATNRAVSIIGATTGQKFTATEIG